MATTQAVDIDDIWRALGPWGKYQWKQLLSYLFICVSWSIHTLTIVFIGYRPNYKCAPPPNDTLSLVNDTDVWREYDKCSIKLHTNTSNGGEAVTETGCENGWEYDIPVEQSFVTEWNLVCETEELAEITQVLLTVGMMIGSIVGPSLSDRFGRKVVMVFSHIGLFAVVLGTSFCQSYTAFIVLRILTGAVQQGALAGTTLALETFPTEHRAYTEPLALTVWTTALCIMSPIAYFLRNESWRYLQLTYALLSAWSIFQWCMCAVLRTCSPDIINCQTICISYFLFVMILFYPHPIQVVLAMMLDESLRWLIANGKLDRARQVIKNACKWNKKDYATVMATVGFHDEELDKEPCQVEMKTVTNTPDVIKKETGGEDGKTETTDGEEKDEESTKFIKKDLGPAKVLVQKYTALDIIRNGRILRVSLIMWFTWLTDSLVYYGLYMISSDLYGDRYINFFLSALCEYPACAFEFWALNKLGRPLTCIMCHLIAAVGLILATIFTSLAGDNTSMMAAATAFTIIGKMGATAAFSCSFVLTPELYPTNMRNAGLGVASGAGKLGAMVAPFFRNLAVRVLWAPGAIFAVFCLVVCGAMFWVPETLGVELPQTTDELSTYYQNNRLSISHIKQRFKKQKQGIN